MRKILIFLNGAGILALLCLLWFIFRYSRTIPRIPDDLRLLAAVPPTQVYDRYGQLLGSLGGRQYISLERISPHFLNAIVATEDRHFWRHRGIFHPAILRALYLNLTLGEGAPGGSTITQQLAKNLFFSFRRSWERKIKEAIAAAAIERRFSKKEILEAYCNLVYFGRQAYGVEEASQTYFGKHAWQLNLPEAALLAGLPKAPAALDPIAHPEKARQRQRTVLRRMATAGYIKPHQVDSLAQLPLTLRTSFLRENTLFAIDGAILEAKTLLEPDLVDYGGIKIYTTIDPELQKLGQRILSTGLEILESNLKGGGGDERLEGALVAVEVGSGEVLALVSGRDYGTSVYPRALWSRRPPGSAFKPVVYLTALENLPISPNTVVEDKPVEFMIPGSGVWRPKNFDKEYRGSISLRTALEWSVNTIAAQLTDQVGPEKVVKTARMLGVNSPLEPHLSLALGAMGITPLEMATVTATIARNGVFIPSHIIRRIEGPGGELLREVLPSSERRFDPEAVTTLIDMLKGVIIRGTGTVVAKRGFTREAFGKTGTSSDYRDSWFIGATPYLATVVWVGYDDNRQMFLRDGRGVTGASGAAPIWADFMNIACKNYPEASFPSPQETALP